jgi:hypothetical protein
MKYITILFLFVCQINFGQCNTDTKVQYYSDIELNFKGNYNVSVTFGKGSEISNSYNYIGFEQDALYCVIFGTDKKYYVKLFATYNSIYETNCTSINSIFSNGYVKGKDQEGRIWKIYKKTSFNNTYDRPERKYKPVTSNPNLELIDRILREKQKAIDNEREYLASLSYEERKAIVDKKLYSERKNQLYSKNSERLIKAYKKQKKIDKELAKNVKKNNKKFNKSAKINLSEIKNGWHKAFVKINDVIVKRLIFLENGSITKYVGGTGFLSNIHSQTNTKSYETKLEVGYEKNDTTLIYVYFLKNSSIKLKKEPVYPTLVKFYTTTSNQGKMFIYLNGANFSNYLTLEKYFKEGQNITCEQTNGVVIFYVGQGDFEFYAHNSVNQWSGKINTENRYCAIKELSD